MLGRVVAREGTSRGPAEVCAAPTTSGRAARACRPLPQAGGFSLGSAAALARRCSSPAADTARASVLRRGLCSGEGRFACLSRFDGWRHCHSFGQIGRKGQTRRRRLGSRSSRARGAPPEARASAGQASQAKQKKRPFDGISQLLNQVVTATSIPYVTYVPRPRTLLHFLDPRVKQILAVACLVFAARGTIEVRLATCAAIALTSLVCLPRSYSAKQMLSVLKLCLVVGFFTVLAADAVSVPVLERLPSDMGGIEAFRDHTTYKYTLLNLGILKVTRRSVNLAAAAAALQFATIQSTVIILTTTSPEELTKAYTRFFLVPLRWLRLVNLSELSLSVLLSFRFLGLIFEELQNIAKGMLARNISWKDLKLVAKVDIATTLISKAVANLLAISNQIARSMVARGYNSKDFAHPHLLNVPAKSNANSNSDASPTAPETRQEEASTKIQQKDA